MGKFIDETGKVYGRLTVLYRAKRDKGTPVMWHCRCECNNEIDVLGTSLRSGNTKSCGCLQKDKVAKSLIDLTGKKYGFLTVLKRDETKPKGHGKPVYWICKCECGNIVSVSGVHLKTGHTKSCGCYNPTSINFINEIGNKYGRLTVVEEAGRDKDGRVLWRCLCECGNEKITLGKSLRAGLVLSCGCLHSKGEAKITKILKEMNINYISQYHTNELKNNNYFLYFDFFLPNFNVIIEYQGEQHYFPINRGYHDRSSFTELKKRDELKRKYCKEKGIKLVEIPYTEYNQLNSNYIKEVIK